ncbi:hypothetical protein Tco_0717901 [Tanacetum coccineum]
MNERFYKVHNKLEAIRTESARKHKELMDLLKNNAFSSGRAKEVEEWEKWRDLNRAQQASDDIISNPKSQIFPTKNFPTQPEKISEDGGHLKEFQDVLTGDEVDITGPLITVEDEPLMMLGSDLNTIKEDFSNDLDGQHSADKNLYKCSVETRTGSCSKKNMGSWNYSRGHSKATP